MLKIRLIRIGKKNAPAYRVVLTEKQAPVKGKFLEVLGNYNPRLKEINFKKDRVLHWLSVGAQASDTVHNLLVSQGIVEGPKRKRKLKIKKKEEETPAEQAKSPTDGEKTTTDKKESDEKSESKEVKEDKPKEEVKPQQKEKKEEKTEEKKEDKPKS